MTNTLGNLSLIKALVSVNHFLYETFPVHITVQFWSPDWTQLIQLLLQIY